MRRLLGHACVVAFFPLAALLLVSIAAPGVAAISAFRTLPELGLELPQYREFAQGSSEVMGRMAAGHALQPVFVVTAWMTLVLSVVVFAVWLIACRTGTTVPSRRVSRSLATVALVLLILVAAFSAFESRTMTERLTQYHSGAQGTSVDQDRARDTKADFDARHRRAERRNQLEVMLAIAALSLAAAALVPVRPRPSSAGGDAPDREFVKSPGA